ncbi:odorant receptor 49a-like isoform X2 [Maniola hyperantus]|uniref:odorant receptor 49a-like isoform X2 n=1 Tax=Aphantopus hyperantus TaxID=2795564 RepID=UPI00374A958F
MFVFFSSYAYSMPSTRTPRTSPALSRIGLAWRDLRYFIKTESFSAYCPKHGGTISDYEVCISMALGDTGMIKIIVVTIKRNKIKQLFLAIGKLWKIDYENNAKNLEMHSWIRRLKLWDNVMFGAMAVSIMFFAFVPLVVTIYRFYSESKPEYKFLLEMYFFSHVDSHLTYSIAVAYQVVTCVLCQMCIYTPCDYLLLHLSFSIAALLSLVQIDLLSLKGTNLEDLDFYWNDNCEDIKSIVKTHQMLLSLAGRLNKIFKEIIFSQVYLSSVIICCYLFTAVFQMSKYGVAPILGDLMASMAVLVEMLTLAVPGEVIADTSSGIAYAAYQSPWYERSYKFRKYIAILIVRAQKPIHLSALGFSDLTLVMFSKVVSTTWSYLSLLNQMTKKLDL